MDEAERPQSGFSLALGELWFVADAAFAIAKQHSIGEEGRKDLAGRMVECARLAPDNPLHLPTRHLQSQLPKKYTDEIGISTGVYPTDVNAWLVTIGAPYQWVPDSELRRRLIDQWELRSKRRAARQAPLPERHIPPQPLPTIVVGAILKKAAELHAWGIGRAAQLMPARRSQSGPAKSQGDWRALVLPYVLEKLSEGAYATAKDLYRALEAEADIQIESPFRKGVGNHRGKLVVKASNKPLALKTFQNYWPELKEALRQQRAEIPFPQFPGELRSDSGNCGKSE